MTTWRHELASAGIGIENLDPRVVKGGILTRTCTVWRSATWIEAGDLRLALLGIKHGEPVLIKLAVSYQGFGKVFFVEGIGRIDEGNFLKRWFLESCQP